MGGLLLDTHVLLWASASPDRLGQSTTDQLRDHTNQLFVSAVSFAEIAIKRSTGKLEMAMAIEALLEPLLATPLDLTAVQAATVERLPMLHRDPFDRLLAAQALSADLTLVTGDDRLLAYPITVLDART